MSLSLAGPTRAAILSHIERPDLVVDEHGQTSPLALAAATSIGLTGVGVFTALLILSADIRFSGRAVAEILSLLSVPPLTALLTFPPFYLACALRQRAANLQTLLAIACSGPLIAGTTLGAASPLVLLYLLTGDLNIGFYLLVLGLMGLAVLLGGIGARQNAKRTGASDPGHLIVIAHYLLTLWTALVLSAHLI